MPFCVTNSHVGINPSIFTVKRNEWDNLLLKYSLVFQCSIWYKSFFVFKVLVIRPPCRKLIPTTNHFVEFDNENPFHQSNSHSSEDSSNRGLVLVSTPFYGSNFHSWRSAMLTALTLKNKRGFIDGSIHVATVDELINDAWTRLLASHCCFSGDSQQPPLLWNRIGDLVRST